MIPEEVQPEPDDGGPDFVSWAANGPANVTVPSDM